MNRKKTFDSVPDVITLSQFQKSTLKLPACIAGKRHFSVWYFHWNVDYLLVYNAFLEKWCLLHRNMLETYKKNYNVPAMLNSMPIIAGKNKAWFDTREQCVNAHSDFLHEVAVTGDVIVHTTERNIAKASGEGRATSRAWKNGKYWY